MVVMGRVIAPFGIKGWFKVRPFTAEPATLLQYPRWWVRPAAGNWRSLALTTGQAQGANLLVAVEGVADRAAASALNGAEVAIERDELPDAGADEIYWAELEGLTVVNRQGLELGRVVAVADFGAHPVLRVADSTGGPERLIPFVAAHVDSVDLVAGRVGVDWQPDY